MNSIKLFFIDIHKNPIFLYGLVLLFGIQKTIAQTDYKLWLQYNKVANSEKITEYKAINKNIVTIGNSETIQIAAKELQNAFKSLINKTVPLSNKTAESANIILANESNLSPELLNQTKTELQKINNEGFVIKTIQLKKQTSNFNYF